MQRFESTIGASDFATVIDRIPLRKTLSFFALVIAFIASVAYDTLLVRSDERLGPPVAALVIASLGATLLLRRYQFSHIRALFNSNWPLHVFSASFLIVCLVFHGGARLGSVVVYTLVAYATYAVLPLILTTDRGLLQAFVRLIAISSGCLAIPSLYGSLGQQSFLGLPLHLKPHYASLSGIVASGGVFEHGEGHALQMAAGILCCLYAIRSSGGVTYYLCLLLASLGLLVSQGRAAVLGLVVALSVCFLPTLFRRSPVVFVGSLVTILILPFVIWTQLENVPGLAGYFRLERGLSGREAAWQYAVSLVEERPWTGFGFLASSELTELHSKWLLTMGFTGAGTTFHNTFISKTVDLGIIVAALYAMLYLVPMIRICRLSEWPLDQRLVRGMILLTLTTALFRDYNIGGVRSTAIIGAVFLGIANLWPPRWTEEARIAESEDRQVDSDLPPTWVCRVTESK